jgi:CheY-like chemotaxis protein
LQIPMKTLRVLVADDNPINLKIMRGLLQTLGHTGVTVNDGAKALRCLDQLPFDLVLMDVEMPEMDGLEALAAIRQGEKAGKPHMPLIIVSANDLPGDRQRFLKMGADGYVPKPASLEALKAEIAKVIP